FAGASDEHPVSGREGEAGEHRADLACAEDGKGAATAVVVRAGDGGGAATAVVVRLAHGAPSARISRTIGMTLVPYSSTARSRALAGAGPLEYFRAKRPTPTVRMVAAILRATVSGEPTYSEP